MQRLYKDEEYLIFQPYSGVLYSLWIELLHLLLTDMTRSRRIRRIWVVCFEAMESENSNTICWLMSLAGIF